MGNAQAAGNHRLSGRDQMRSPVGKRGQKLNVVVELSLVGGGGGGQPTKNDGKKRDDGGPYSLKVSVRWRHTQRGDATQTFYFHRKREEGATNAFN